MGNKKILLTGIQPTNKLTIGNYLGAIKPITKHQKEYECYVFIADLHSITIPLNLQKSSYKQIENYRLELLKTLVACGIDPIANRLFIQSKVKEHLELFYFLITHSYLGELKRMTQYKHLAKQFTPSNGTEMSPMGLLMYPILMSSDILIYDVDYVSIGEDQTQHLELTIDLAQRINSKYDKEIFKIPKSFNPLGNKAGIKIKDLQNPDIKMSKSSKSYEGVIFLNDDPETIKEKIIKAKTDSIGKINIDRKNQPGIVNLLEIYSQITDISLEEAYERLKNNTYKELKEVVAEVVIRELKPIQERYKNIDLKKLMEEIEKNNLFCSQKAKEKIRYLEENI